MLFKVETEHLRAKNRLPQYQPISTPHKMTCSLIERVWLNLKERYLSHRVLSDYEAILDAVCDAWNKLIDEPGRLKSLTHAPWLSSVKT